MQLSERLGYIHCDAKDVIACVSSKIQELCGWARGPTRARLSKAPRRAPKKPCLRPCDSGSRARGSGGCARCGEQQQQQASCFIPFFLNEHRGLPLFCSSTCSSSGVGFLLPCCLAIHHQNEDSVVHCSLQHTVPGGRRREVEKSSTAEILRPSHSWRRSESLVRGKSVVLSPVAVARGRCRTVFRHDLAPRRPHQAPPEPPPPSGRAPLAKSRRRSGRGAPGSPHPRWDMGQEAAAP